MSYMLKFAPMGTRLCAGHAVHECPCSRAVPSGAQGLLAPPTGRRQGGDGGPGGLYAQAADDPQRPGETPDTLATPGGVCRLKAEPLDKQDSCSAPGERSQSP
jgi:hypothetical protein